MGKGKRLRKMRAANAVIVQKKRQQYVVAVATNAATRC